MEKLRCNECAKQFKTNYDLYQHNLTHTSRAPLPSPSSVPVVPHTPSAPVTKDVKKWDDDKKWRFYERQNREMKRSCSDSKALITNLNNQLQEFRDLDDECELESFTKSVINPTTLKNINKVCLLIDGGKYSQISKSNPMLTAIQKMCLGLSYGIIPTTSSQKRALSKDERGLIKKLENATCEKVRRSLLTHKAVLLKILAVIKPSITLVRDSYELYK